MNFVEELRWRGMLQDIMPDVYKRQHIRFFMILSKLWLTMRNLIGSWTNINWRNIKGYCLSVQKHWFLV